MAYRPASANSSEESPPHPDSTSEAAEDTEQGGPIERCGTRRALLRRVTSELKVSTFTKTFALVAKMVTVRVVLTVALYNNWDFFKLDVNNAFLHGDLEEKVYMRPPPVINNVAPGQENETFLAVLLYVDDFILTGNNVQQCASFKNYLDKCFRIRLWETEVFPWYRSSRTADSLFLCQRKYTLDILEETGMTGTRPAAFPMEQHLRLSPDNGAELVDPSSYQRLMGRMLYLTITRLELSYPVHVLSQFMQCPRQPHWDAAIQVLRYLKQNPGRGLLFKRPSTLSLTAYCDSDWATCSQSRRSVSGYFISLGGRPISWKTKRQITVARSLVEAEYRSMASTTATELTFFSRHIPQLSDQSIVRQHGRTSHSGKSRVP
ncbi:hypothetical protein CRG98_027391 [Punica granatum]|uniref:Reverse transcriptase Ty1/copia-type domain-containing protein n=1 Tax=Punica granatum TaxID=22663 RepID=A0A2I0J936_PUNGR|nr:hypothetical protein CRG98_027391 [Punica granatum]